MSWNVKSVVGIINRWTCPIIYYEYLRERQKNQWGVSCIISASRSVLRCDGGALGHLIDQRQNISIKTKNRGISSVFLYSKPGILPRRPRCRT